MTLTNMNDEYICDFFVSAKKKQANALFLEIMQEFERLCQESGLTYWVFAGGLLGAVRHKGFIPWDDDLDVLMPRKDFDRLQAMTHEEFGAKAPYFLQNFTTDPTCAQSLMRFRRSDTTDIRDYDLAYMRRHPDEKPYNMGMGIAIFPIDGLPESKLVQKLQTKIVYTLRGMFYRAYCGDENKPFQHWLSRAVMGIIGEQRAMRIIHWIYRAPRRFNREYVQCFNGCYPTYNIWPKSAFEGSVFLPFESIVIRCPADYKVILTRMYKNYMEFPPVEKRVEKHGGYTVSDVPYEISLEKLLRED